MNDKKVNINLVFSTNASNVEAVVDKLNKTIEESTEATDSSSKSLDKNSKSLLDNSGAMGFLNVVTAGYAGKLRDAIDSTSNFITTGKTAVQTLDAQTTSTVVATTATSGMSIALKVLRVALISTGLGAVVVVLGSLIAYLSGTQEGLNKVTKVTRPLMAVFESLMGVVQNLGKKFFDALSNPKKLLLDLVDFIKGQVINRIKALGIVLEGIVNLDFGKIKEGFIQYGSGVVDLTGKIKAAGEESKKFLDEAIKKGKELDALEKKLTQTRIYNAEALGKLNEQFKQQNLIAEDQTKSLKVREAAAVKTIEIAKRINTLKQSELDLEIAIMENKHSRNDTSDTEKLELAELNAKRNASNAAELDSLTSQQKKLNRIRKQGQADAQKISDDAKAKAQKILDDAKAKEDKERADERSKHIENEKTRISEEANSLKTLEDLRDKTEEEKLARQKKRDKEEIRALSDKGIDIRQLLKDHTDKYNILEDELKEKRRVEKKAKDDEDDAKDLEDQKVINDALIQQEIDLEAAREDVTKKGLALVSNVFGKSKAIQKAVMITEGALAIGKMVASNNVANIGALATPLAIAQPATAIPVIAMNNKTTAIGIASTVAATAKAISALGGGGGGISGGSGGNISAGTQPKVDFITSNENQIANNINNKNKNDDKPIEVFLTPKTVTTALEMARNINDTTTI